MHTITGMVMLKSDKASGTNVEPFRGRRRSQKKEGAAPHDRTSGFAVVHGPRKRYF